MPEKDVQTAKRIDSVLESMTDKQRELFLAHGEGIVVGYKMGRADASQLIPAQNGMVAQ